MTGIWALGLSFHHQDCVPLFLKVDFHLPSGWTGLVGANGSGKTTLLELLAGTLVPGSGRIQRDPSVQRVVLCPQQVEHCTPDITELASSTDSLGRKLHGRLALTREQVQRWTSLSPGERKRWQQGAALWREPDVLLLDEPTNHLDTVARRYVREALKRFAGIGVVVSHDRELLDGLTTHTLRIHCAGVTGYAGSYSSARALWEREAEAERETHGQLREEVRSLQKRLGDARRNHHAASARKSAGARMKNKHDSDARGVMADFSVSKAEKALGRSVSVLREKHERAAQALAAHGLERSFGRQVFMGYERAPVSRLLVLQTVALMAGDRMLVQDVNVVLHREDRVHLCGANGTGKTTLVRALLDVCCLPEERVLYVPQDITDEEGHALLEQVRSLPREERGRLLSLLAVMGVDPVRALQSDRPSPGEARKMMMASGLARHVWLLVLDEPTNHLDLPSVERLEAALMDYPGCILLVTHDHRLARACTRTRWCLEDGTLRVEDATGEPDGPGG